MTNTSHAMCRRCLSVDVAWVTAKSGKRYLANTTGDTYNATYLRGPHAATCAARNATVALPVAAVRREQRERAMRRYVRLVDAAFAANTITATQAASMVANATRKV